MLDPLKLLMFQMVYFLAKCVPARKRNKHLLLVKVDEIGDYVLVRHCLTYIRNSSRYKDYRITFLGNKIFRQLFEQYDYAVADETIWMDKLKYRRNPFYRFQLFKTLRRGGYSDAINLIYFRSWRLDDVLISICGASNRIGMHNNAAHLTAFEKLLRSKNNYSQLIAVGNDKTFDAIRNAEFISKVVKTSIAPTTQINAGPALPLLEPGLDYCVIFPGSGIADKKWAPENFSKVASHLVTKWKLKVVVCGSAADQMDGDKFLGSFQHPVLNLLGKTNLIELLSILRAAKCLVSVDTGVVHLAAAVGCPVFGLFNGLHYGRFAPYPSEIAVNFFPIYTDQVDSMIADGSIDDKKVEMDFVKYIPVGKVLDTIDSFFEKQHD